MNSTVRFAGFGGQGIVKTGQIFGAAAVADKKQSMQNQSYGSSARGGVCTADVTVADGEIYELEPDEFDVLVLLSQDSCNAFADHLKEGGVLIYEEDLVTLPAALAGTGHAVPATQIAAGELGRRIVMNMVVLGFTAGLTGLVDRQAIEQTIRENVPPGTEDLNLQAFDLGFQRARK